MAFRRRSLSMVTVRTAPSRDTRTWSDISLPACLRAPPSPLVGKGWGGVAAPGPVRTGAPGATVSPLRCAFHWPRIAHRIVSRAGTGGCMGRLQGKAALIFGAGSVGEGWGNGRATAAVMLREGARVFGTDRDPAALARTVEMVAEHGRMESRSLRCHRRGRPRRRRRRLPRGLRADRHPRQQCRRLGARRRRRRSNSAAWDRQFATNIDYVFETMKRVVPLMVEPGRRRHRQSRLDRGAALLRARLRRLCRRQGRADQDGPGHGREVRPSPCPGEHRRARA